MDTYGYIYITTNKVNGKRYIGQHKSVDWDYKYFGSGVYLKRAIKKHGIENFTCLPLARAWNKNELNQLEIDYIAHYKPEYNLTNGGEGGDTFTLTGIENQNIRRKKVSSLHKGKITSDETKKRMSKSAIERFIKNPHSEETREKMSKSRKGIKHPIQSKKMTGLKNPMYGKNHTEEAKQKISKNRRGIPSKLKNSHFYNNGIKNIRAFECPIGFVRGRIAKLISC